MKSYFVQGLYVNSSIDFPEFTPIEKVNNYDAVIKFGEFNVVKDYCEIDLGYFIKAVLTSEGIHLFLNNIPLFMISNGNKIIINPQNCLENSYLKLLILGYGLPLLLHQRGDLILHANAVDMGDGALVLLGSQGTGKSTTSLALHKKGYNLLADDIIRVKFDVENSPIVFPGFPRIKLWPDVIISIQEDPESIPRIHKKAKKHYYPLINNFLKEPQPIRSFYFIEKNDQTKIEPINSHYSLLNLIKSSYCFKFFDEHDLTNNFDHCAKIVQKVPVKKLKIKQSLQDMPQLVKIIENDFFRNTSENV